MLRKSLLLISFAQTFLFAQYIPFPTDNAVWVNHRYYFGGEWTTPTPNELDQIENFCVNNEDTVINSNAYIKLSYCDGSYRGALRDAGGQVFFVSKDSLEERLLYDFTVEIGDTLTNLFFQNLWVDTLYVSNVSSILIGGQSRKTVFLSLESDLNSSLGAYWIEGVGCTAGLLVDPDVNNNISGIYARLECFSSNDSLFSPVSNFYYMGSGTCQLNYLSDNQLFEEPFNIYPNPANDIVYVQFSNSNEPFEISIFNSLGQRVYVESVQENQFPFSITVLDWQPGIYFVSVKNSTGIFSDKFIKN